MYVFIDDFSTHTFNDDHIIMLKVCFDQYYNYGMTLNSKKIYLAIQRATLLDNVVSNEGKGPHSKKKKNHCQFTNRQLMLRRYKGFLITLGGIGTPCMIMQHLSFP
jgi:hypothetical protein